MKLVLYALIVHGLLTLWVGWQLYQLRSEINVAKELLDGIRVALAGSLKEKTIYLKDGYKTLKDVLFNP